MPQTSSQLLYSTRRLLVKQVQNDAANFTSNCTSSSSHATTAYKLLTTIMCKAIKSAKSPCILNFTHCQTFRIPHNRSKNSTMLLLTRTLDACNLDQAPSLIRPALQLCNEETISQKFSSQSARGIQDMTAARNAKEKCRKKRGRSTTRAVKGGLAVIGMSMICAYVSRSWSGKSNSSCNS